MSPAEAAAWIEAYADALHSHHDPDAWPDEHLHWREYCGLLRLLLSDIREGRVEYARRAADGLTFRGQSSRRWPDIAPKRRQPQSRWYVRFSRRVAIFTRRLLREVRP